MVWTKFSQFLTAYGCLSLAPLGKGDEFAVRAAIKAFAEEHGRRIRKLCIDECLPFHSLDGDAVEEILGQMKLPDPEMD